MSIITGFACFFFVVSRVELTCVCVRVCFVFGAEHGEPGQGVAVPTAAQQPAGGLQVRSLLYQRGQFCFGVRACVRASACVAEIPVETRVSILGLDTVFTSSIAVTRNYCF